MKKKFLFENTKNILSHNDIVIISETHFNIRTKCPEGFYLAGRSKASESDKARGGVAVFKNILCNMKLNIITDDLKDCVIFEICNTQIVVIAIYIVPSNSKYYTEMYFKNLELMIEHFKNRQIIIIGDMNSRVGTPTKHMFDYIENPDVTINSNGRSLLKILERNDDLFIVNGLNDSNITCESKFTFFRGDLRSQNDLCIMNNRTSIEEIMIQTKVSQSDHCPCLLTVKTRVNPDLRILDECA